MCVIIPKLKNLRLSNKALLNDFTDGAPLAAIWLLGKVQSLKFAIQDWVYG